MSEQNLNSPDTDTPVSLEEKLVDEEDVNNSSRSMLLPSVRVLLREHKLKAHEVKATGKGGRLSKEDVQRHLSTPDTFEAKPHEQDLVLRESHSKDKRMQLGPVQRQMFQSMTQSLAIPHLYYTHMVDLSEINLIKSRFYNNVVPNLTIDKGGENSLKLRTLPFIVKIISAAFLKYPFMNAHLDAETNSSDVELILKGSHDIGIAMDTPKGLLVPVIKAVQDHSVLTLAYEIDRLSALARENRLKPEDLRGASFVVSNIGSLGGHTVGPVILPPTVGIVAVGRSKRTPSVWSDGAGNENIVIKEKVVLSWAADHRVIDGASIARCAEYVGTCLENLNSLSIVLR